MAAPWTKAPLNGRGPGSVVVPFNPNSIVRQDGKLTPVKVPAKQSIPLGKRSLTAASKRIDLNKNDALDLKRKLESAAWQKEAFGMARQVGELNYAATLFSNGCSRITMRLAKKKPGSRIVETLDEVGRGRWDRRVQEIVDNLEYCVPLEELQRLATYNEFIGGEYILVGLPTRDPHALLGCEWAIFNRDDIGENNGVVKIAGKEYDASTVILIRGWNPDPQFNDLATSSVRSALPILRELVGLTMYVSAIIDSRLAGAGLLILPTSATVLGSTAPEDDQDEDPTVAALIEAMVTPIKDRDSAASVVPLILTAPDESVAGIQHITFATPLDAVAKELRDELIRRLALSLNMPPGQLLGLEGASHWNAWAVQEDSVRLHFVPAVQRFGRALLKGLIIPVLLEEGCPEDVAHLYTWLLDDDELVSRPNQFEQAMELYRVNGIKLNTVLEAAGFDITDAPELGSDDPAIEWAIKSAMLNPNMFVEPGLPAIVSQLRSVLAGQDASDAPEDALPAEPAAPAESEGRPAQSQTQPGARRAVEDRNEPGRPKTQPPASK